MAYGSPYKKFLESELSPFDENPMGWSEMLAWVYPNNYEVGMSNIGYQWLYGLLREHRYLLTERFFDFGDDPRSLEAGKKLGQFPAIAVSIPYELDVTRFLAMLKRAGIPLLSSERKRAPIIIAGGNAPTLNPYPYKDFFDIIVLGDGERWANEFPRIIAELNPGRCEKRDILIRASEIPGVWIPEMDDQFTGERAVRDESIPAYTPIITSFGHFRNMFLIEIQRGCPFRCGFCSSPWLGNSFTNFSSESILETYKKYGRGTKRVGLVGSAISEHPQLEEILVQLQNEGIEAHPSSIRLDRISTKTIGILADTGARSITFAPETASPRIGKMIGKSISKEEIIEAAKKLTKLGFSEMKLYWILGLPDEEVCDIEMMVDFIREILEKCEIRVICSVNPFMPKPHSRFQDRPMMTHQELRRRFRMLKDGLKGLQRLNLEINYSFNSRLSAILSIGGTNLSKVMMNIAKGTPAKRALKDAGIDYRDEIVLDTKNPVLKIR